ncbi:MAG: carbohydrate ABC transporter permease [Faecalicatena sp.]|uniref:carbohydrate ABC transporter permease n=1 Tax=Faecalicatena sp. TaxID=2005360 RepID=UPI00258AA3D7|nr:carbohydrate ABC transporter permease [Faecalicatena sp.]MCI6467783.1 carbohydrate ABC transporter permease [Faecalicatena sp.]MDY5619575.1 carbohydrate ABC transporter permease [Lachnospiraceae bacterium]
MKKIKYGTVIKHILLVTGAIIMLVPFVWMILTSFKTISEATQMNPFVIFPSEWRIDAFENVIRKMDFFKLYLNTFLMIAGRILCAVLTATMAGYAFARLKFRGKNFCFALVLFQMMVPTQIFIIPQYLMVSKIGMLNTLFSLLFPGLVTAFGTFLLKQNYMSLPKELEEAARLDGCNIGQTFLYVMMPLTKASMVALGIFTALFAYKDLMWPLIANTEQSTMTLAPALSKLQGQFSSNYPELMAASLIACLPMIILYLLFQKQFVEGIATSGGKL